MALIVDTTRAFRTLARRTDLVRAVRAANEHDEAAWVEWKSTLELGKPAGRFHVARAVLALSNRSVTQAQLHAEGTGYVVVGASHGGELAGVETVDLASFVPAVSEYTGQHPQVAEWEPVYVELDGKQVLVVTVEAPRPGDRIAVLRKGAEKDNPGVVFGRRGPSSDRARASQMDALQDRLLAGSSVEVQQIDPLAVSIDFSGDVYLFDDSEEARREWLSKRREAIDGLKRVEAEKYGEAPTRRPALMLGNGMLLNPEPERLTNERVSRHMRECSDKMYRTAINRIVNDNDANKFTVSVTNHGTQTVPSVEVLVRLPSGMTAFDRPTGDAKMPTNVIPPTRNYILERPDIDFSSIRPAGGPRPGDVAVNANDRSTIRVWFGDVRKDQTVESDAVTLIASVDRDRRDARVSFQATSSTVPGDVVGSTAVPLSDEAALTYDSLIGPPSAVKR